MADARARFRFDGVFGTSSKSWSGPSGSTAASESASEASDRCSGDREDEEDPRGSGSNSSSSRLAFVRAFFLGGGLALADALRAGFDLFEGLGGGESSSDSASVSTSCLLAAETVHLDQSPGGPVFA